VEAPSEPGTPELTPTAEAVSPLRRALPFVTAALLIAIVLARLDVGLLVRKLGSTNYLAILSFAAAATLGLIGADTVATVGIYRRTIGRVSFRQFFVLRAASYLPSLLNHHVGQAWLTYSISKAYRTPVWRVAGATAISYVTTLGCLLAFGIIALPFNLDRSPWLGLVVFPATALGLAYLVVIAVAPARLRTWQVTAPLVEMGLFGHFVAFALRIPHMIVLFVATWVPFRLFGVRIPFTQALATVPGVMLVAGLPVTPQGVGTRDLLAVQLFSNYAAGTTDERRASIVAASLCWAGAMTFVHLIISPIFMRRARRLLREVGSISAS
jgi:hypothetical protein